MIAIGAGDCYWGAFRISSCLAGSHDLDPVEAMRK